MGGAKSRALCEDFFQAALDYPGILAPIFRQRHNSITQTTRRTFFDQVLPPELRPYCKTRQSGGEDFIRFPNGSEVHFLGLDDPVKAFSAEFGMVGFDEAHEMDEEDVVLINTRLRQRCAECIRVSIPDCLHYPHTLALGFNPEDPGHWLHKWFMEGAEDTEHGKIKDEVYPTDAVAPIGDAEFIKALPTDNPYLPTGYIEQKLGGMPELLRRRYMNGEWVFVEGLCFFDVEALHDYDHAGRVHRPEYRFDFRTVGVGAQARRARSSQGMIHVYEEPQKKLSYAIGVDVATGRGQDFSCAYVTRLDEPTLVCELRGKIDQDLLAEQLHFLGRWYGTQSACARDAFIAIENQMGGGDAVIVPLRDGKGARPPYNRLYRHTLATRPDMPMVKPFGYPMNSHTRPLVTNALAAAIREQVLPFLPQALFDECPVFVYHKEGTSPRARDGRNDDCVFAAAIALELYRQKGHHPAREVRLEGKRAQRRKLKEFLARDPFYRPSKRRIPA